MRKFTVLIIASLLILFANSANADSFAVDANLSTLSLGYAGGGSCLDTGKPPCPALVDTGLDINVGDLIEITAVGSWRMSGSDPYTDADGQVGRSIFAPAPWLTASALLGQISDAPLYVGDQGVFDVTFLVGTNFSEVSTLSGRLFLAYSDTDYGNNDGSVIATIKVTPVSKPPVEMLIDKVKIDLVDGEFKIKGYLDITDPAFDELVVYPKFKIRLELQTDGTDEHPEFGIISQDQVQLTTDNDWEDMKFKADDDDEHEEDKNKGKKDKK